MSPGKRVFVGTPGTRETPTECWDGFEAWRDPDNTGKHTVHCRADTTSGHLDMARTKLIRLGLEKRGDYIAQRDADVAVETPFLDVMSYLAQDFSQGAGIVFSPTTSYDWKPQFHPLPGTPQSECPNNSAFRCFAGAGGFMVMTRDVAERLKIVAWNSYGYGPGTDETGILEVGLLCSNNNAAEKGQATRSEDTSLMRNVEDSTGKFVVCDPRILTGHYKPHYRPSWRPEEFIPESVRRFK